MESGILDVGMGGYRIDKTISGTPYPRRVARAEGGRAFGPTNGEDQRAVLANLVGKEGRGCAALSGRSDLEAFTQGYARRTRSPWAFFGRPVRARTAVARVRIALLGRDLLLAPAPTCQSVGYFLWPMGWGWGPSRRIFWRLIARWTSEHRWKFGGSSTGRRSRAADGRLDLGDVDLLHFHHGFEGALCHVAALGHCVSQNARGDLP